MSLKTNYKNDAWEGKRKYLLTENDDGTISLDDVTNYTIIGDIFNGDDINATNTAVNANAQGLVTERNTTNQQITAERNTTNQQIQAVNQQIASERTTTNQQINTVNQTISALDTSVTKVQTVTFSVNGWSSSAPYTQQIAVSGIKSTDSPIPGLIYPSSMTEAQKENIDKSSDMITELETLNGYVKATCRFKKPIADITIGLKGR